jgi:hypothetical protein
VKIKNVLIKTYVIALSHGDWKHKSKIQTFLKNVNCDNSDVIYIDTSKKGSSNQEINRAFEFSGYQYGLTKFIENSVFSENLRTKLIFINDTLFESHIFLMPMFLSYVINRINPYAFSIIGLKQNTISQYSGEKNKCFYIPTFCFAICGQKQDLVAVKFYDEEACSPLGLQSVLNKLATEYRDAINYWLNPRSFFAGWYKSVPWKRLDNRTYVRKRLCIYFEHSLISRLNYVGCKCIFINDVKNFRIWILLLMFFDRLFINYKKIIFRLKEKLNT